MSCSVRIERIEVDGWKPPHAVKIELTGMIDQTVSDGIVTAMRQRANELRDAIAPTVEEAIQGILLDRAADSLERSDEDIADFEL